MPGRLQCQNCSDKGAARARLRNTGCDADTYAALLDAQEGKCAICRLPPVKWRLAADHDHVTGNVRGLLCVKCNAGLGQLGDTVKGLERALAYLRRSNPKKEG